VKLQDIETELKTLIVEALMLKDTTPEQISTTAPLFVEGLGLDSIDALELGMAIEGRWGFKIGADEAKARQAFASVQSLAVFILEKLPTTEASSLS
jgi:acyl carrier protein